MCIWESYRFLQTPFFNLIKCVNEVLEVELMFFFFFTIWLEPDCLLHNTRLAISKPRLFSITDKALWMLYWLFKTARICKSRFRHWLISKNCFDLVTQQKLDGKRKEAKKKPWYVYDALFITGGSMHHGNEENLPKTKSKRSLCQGPRSVYFSDVRLLLVHRSRFWVVSSLLGSYTLHFIKSNARHLIRLQRRSVWSKENAPEEENFKYCVIKFTAFSCIFMDSTFFKTKPHV